MSPNSTRSVSQWNTKFRVLQNKLIRIFHKEKLKWYEYSLINNSMIN